MRHGEGSGGRCPIQHGRDQFAFLVSGKVGLDLAASLHILFFAFFSNLVFLGSFGRYRASHPSERVCVPCPYIRAFPGVEFIREFDVCVGLAHTQHSPSVELHYVFVQPAQQCHELPSGRGDSSLFLHFYSIQCVCAVFYPVLDDGAFEEGRRTYGVQSKIDES